MRLHARPLLLALAAASLAACDGHGGPVQPGDQEGLRFRYTGRISGEYSSEGMPSLNGAGVPAFGEWAIARPDSIGGLIMVGFEPTTSPRGNLFILQVTPRSTGEFTPCNLHVSGCHGRFITGVNTQDLSARPDDWYEVVQGNVTLTEVSSTRVRGSFALRLVNTSANDTITVTDGSIDIPFSSDLLLSNGINCWARNVQNGTNQPCGS